MNQKQFLCDGPLFYCSRDSVAQIKDTFDVVIALTSIIGAKRGPKYMSSA